MDKIKRLAHRARKNVEAVSSNRTLEGCCGVGSINLMRLACSKKIFPTFVEGCFRFGGFYDLFHCWLEYRGMIVDITATQFNRNHPRVYVVKSTDSRYRPQHKTRSLTDALHWVEGWDVYPESLMP